MFEMLDLVLIYLYDRIPHGIPKSSILKEVFDGDDTTPIEAILLHLETEGHIYQTLSLIGQQFFVSPDCYSVTICGMEFTRNSSIPNRPYRCKENCRLQDLRDNVVTAKLAKKADWPKQNWIALLLITFALGIVSTLSAEFLKKKLFPDSPTTPSAPVSSDTIRTTPTSHP